MAKLITPVQYEDTLDELNKVRPLVLNDEVKRNIDLPVLDANLVAKKGSALGKLLRCTNEGSLLVKNHNGFDNVEIKPFDIERRYEQTTFTFAQEVFGVLCNVIINDVITEFYVTDSTGTIHAQDIGLTGTTWIKFRGTAIWVRVIGELPRDYVAGNFYGFY